MTLRCDHCRRPLGLMVRRYWHMRFCSVPCMEAYQQRLLDDTKQKIADIRQADLAGGEQKRLPPHLLRIGVEGDRAPRDTAGRSAS